MLFIRHLCVHVSVIDYALKHSWRRINNHADRPSPSSSFHVAECPKGSCWELRMDSVHATGRPDERSSFRCFAHGGNLIILPFTQDRGHPTLESTVYTRPNDTNGMLMAFTLHISLPVIIIQTSLSVPWLSPLCKFWHYLWEGVAMY